MKTIAITKFKEQCLALLERLDEEGILVSKHGKPIAKIVPYKRQNAELIGCLKHEIKIHHDNLFSTDSQWSVNDKS